MDNWEGLMKYGSILFFTILLDLIFGPIIEIFVEFGLNIEMTVGGVTAPTKDILDPATLIMYKLMWHIIDIGGWYVIIWGVLKKFQLI